jgi:hypothetical protein
MGGERSTTVAEPTDCTAARASAVWRGTEKVAPVAVAVAVAAAAAREGEPWCTVEDEGENDAADTRALPDESAVRRLTSPAKPSSPKLTLSAAAAVSTGSGMRPVAPALASSPPPHPAPATPSSPRPPSAPPSSSS